MRVEPYICYQRRCGLELAMFVFLVLSMLYPNDKLIGFAKATKDLPSCKAVLEAIKFEVPVLKWTSESEYFLSLIFFLQTLYK